MAGGFTSPAILFLSTWDAPERSFCKQVFSQLKARGYTRFVEPCAGAFAMPVVAHAAGWNGREMEASDTSLFSSIVGTMMAGNDLHDLGVALDGEKVDIPGDSLVEQASHLLWLQLWARTKVRPDVEYWRLLIADIEERQAEHCKAIGQRLQGYMDKMGGLTYHPLDMFSHIEQVRDDPRTVISINPPTYRCCAWGTRVLTADLRWVDVKDVRVGDSLMGVDAYSPGETRRKYRPSEVLRSEAVDVPCVEVELSDGTRVVTTPDHPWLARTGPGAERHWVESVDMPGLQAHRALDTWDEDTSYDGGWIAGMYDGEGSLNARGGPKASYQLVMSQKQGPLMDRFEGLMRERGFKVAVRDGQNCAVAVLSESAEVVRALGMFRPGRLLPKMPIERPCRVIDTPTVVAVEPVGTRTIQSLTTSTGTYVGEGFLMHNSGFEKFFDTKGRLTWNEPPYEVFDPVEGNEHLTAMMEGKAALILAQQQKEPKHCSHPRPVFARHLSPGQNVYLWSNRPDEVFDITGGPKVAPKGGQTLSPASCPILPMDYEVTEDTKVGLHLVPAQVADYYRGLWMHRLNAEPGGQNVLLTLDGHAAGVMGYSAASMQTPYNDRWSEFLILRFAFGAPHDSLRLTRLATMVALRKETTYLTLTPRNSIVLAASEGLVTVEYTRHPEAKGLRGLMKLADRQKHPDGYKLVYSGAWRVESVEDTLTEFLKKEKQWQRSRG
jgi:hypothetical protein